MLYFILCLKCQVDFMKLMMNAFCSSYARIQNASHTGGSVMAPMTAEMVRMNQPLAVRIFLDCALSCPLL